MTLREPTVSRWSHAPQPYRHDYRRTSLRDRCDATTGCLEADAGILALRAALDTLVGVARHAAGRRTSEEATNIPESERGRVYREARVWVAIYSAVIGMAIYVGIWLPLRYVGLPSLYGGWLVHVLALTQHAGLRERARPPPGLSRTIYMNPALRFVY
jgi:fatty acid desaturase